MTIQKVPFGFRNKFYKKYQVYIGALLISEAISETDTIHNEEQSLSFYINKAYNEKIKHYTKLGYSYQAGLSSWLSGVTLERLPFADYEIIDVANQFEMNDYTDLITEYWFDLVAMVMLRRAKELNLTLEGYSND